MSPFVGLVGDHRAISPLGYIGRGITSVNTVKTFIQIRICQRATNIEGLYKDSYTWSGLTTRTREALHESD